MFRQGFRHTTRAREIPTPRVARCPRFPSPIPDPGSPPTNPQLRARPAMGVNDEYLPLGGTCATPHTMTKQPGDTAHPPRGERRPLNTLLVIFSALTPIPTRHTQAPPPTTSRGTHVAAVALGALLVCSCSLNVAQFVGGARGVSEGASLGQAPALGWGASLPKTHAFARMEDPLIDGRCNKRLGAHVHRRRERSEFRDSSVSEQGGNPWDRCRCRCR